MAEFKYTPGPWEWWCLEDGPDDGDFEYNGLRSQEMDYVLEAVDATSGYTDYGCTPRILVSGPNARLLKAAPDLFDALIDLERQSGLPLGHDDPARIKARAAISKARGKGDA
jgi:hypothetical protein